MSWNLPLQLNNLYAAVKALQASAISNPVAASLRINAPATTTTFGITDCASISASTTTGSLILTNFGGTACMTISSGAVATFNQDIVVNGLTIGKGNGVLENTALGVSALSVASPLYNSFSTALGYRALVANTGTILLPSANNTGVGAYALSYTTTGGYNTSIGALAGNSNFTGSNNVHIGYYANGGTSDSNSIVIGSGGIGLGSNTCVLAGSAYKLPYNLATPVSGNGGLAFIGGYQTQTLSTNYTQLTTFSTYIMNIASVPIGVYMLYIQLQVTGSATTNLTPTTFASITTGTPAGQFLQNVYNNLSGPLSTSTAYSLAITPIPFYVTSVATISVGVFGGYTGSAPFYNSGAQNFMTLVRIG